MTERQKLVEKARKVAALITSPVEGEMIAASLKLKQLMNEYNLTFDELGLSINNTNTASCNRTTKVNYDGIMEVIFKRNYHEMPDWTKDLIAKISRSFGVRCCVCNASIRFIGYRPDITVLKHELLNILAFVEGKIQNLVNADARYIDSYATGLTDKINLGIGINTNDAAKEFSLYKYFKTHYGIAAMLTYREFNFLNPAYQSGLQDGCYYYPKGAL